jgi:hypothetical protein
MAFTIHTNVSSTAIKEVYSLTFFHTPEEKITKVKNFWGATQEVKETVDYWTITMIYLRADNEKHTYSAKSPNYEAMIDQFNDLQKQIKQFDSTFIDRAFEEQVLK